jgi:pyruvate dehydrogenase E2 component (dihydrolipoamide acetyltransferase)
MTDKVSLEVEAYNSGYLKKILRAAGEEVPVTEVIAYIGELNEKIPEFSQAKSDTQAAISAEAKETKRSTEVVGKIEVTSIDESRINISPLARNIAEGKNIDISKIAGTGPGGRIVKEDVENYIINLGIQKGAQPAVQPAAQSVSVAQSVQSSVAEERIKISPLARSMAKEMGIDYIKQPINGSGPGGRIVKEDILAFTQAQKMKDAAANIIQTETAPVSILTPAAAAETTMPVGEIKIKSSTQLKGIRKIIAERLTYSSQNIPHIILTAVPDVDRLMALRERSKDKFYTMYQIKVTVTDFITKLCATVLEEQPIINSSLQNNNHIIYEDINIGIATATDEGLIVPTIYNTNKLSILEIAKKRTELIEKAKQHKLVLNEISNGTFTISNLGMFGVRTFTAIINPPQGAILTIGEVYTAPAFVDGKVEPKSYMEVAIAVDHRIIDGAVAAKFLQRFVELIENPVILVT